MAVFCSTQCTTNTAVRLAYQPCPLCPDTAQPPPEPGPVTAEYNSPPSINSLDPTNHNFFLVGSGIPAAHAAVMTDSVIEIFLAPLIAGVDAIAPLGDTTIYNVALQPGQELGMVFGVTLQAPFSITDLYDVSLTVDNNSTVVTLQLVKDDSVPSGYRWSDGAGYDIVDSVGNAMKTTVQNVTRLTYLVDGGLLPASVIEPGSTLWILAATPRNGTSPEVEVGVVTNVS